MKNMNDFKLAFIIGLTVYALRSLLDKGNANGDLALWMLANAITAILHIWLTLGAIKVIKWLIKTTNDITKSIK